MVKLYEPRLSECGVNMVEMGNGDWVSYEDYAALEETALIAMEALEKAQKQIDNLERALGAGELRYD